MVSALKHTTVSSISSDLTTTTPNVNMHAGDSFCTAVQQREAKVYCSTEAITSMHDYIKSSSS